MSDLLYRSEVTYMYTVCYEKEVAILFPVTSRNLVRFSKFVHRLKFLSHIKWREIIHRQCPSMYSRD